MRPTTVSAWAALSTLIVATTCVMTKGGWMRWGDGCVDGVGTEGGMDGGRSAQVRLRQPPRCQIAICGGAQHPRDCAEIRR